MHRHDVVTRALAVAMFAAGAGCAAPSVPPVLSGSAVHGDPPARAVSEPSPTAFVDLTTDAPGCPIFPPACLAGGTPVDCPAPPPPAVIFAANSAVVPGGARPTLDRVVRDSRWFTDDTRVVLSTDIAHLEPPDLAEQRVAAVKDALIARGMRGRGIVTVATDVYFVDEIPAPPSNRVEIALRGCR